MTLLVGDIGGTNARFGLTPEGGLRPAGVGVRLGDDHASFASALAAYLATVAVRPSRAAFAVAGPVEGGRARITNRPAWEIDAAALAAEFGFERVAVVNDFVAQAACLPHLEPSELLAIGAAEPRHGVKAAVGPGTGLGVAALLPDRGGWRAVESEGGHVELAATDAREAAAFEIIRCEHGRVSAEHVLSGPGLARLHAALGQAEGRPGAPVSARQLVQRAEAGEAAARETVALFVKMLARFAGDVALTFGARGGIYLCGGIAPRLQRLIDPARFRDAFEAKEPHRALMRETAVSVVTSPIAGLIGCAASTQEQRAVDHKV